jgi:NAD(P)-dependent dehydrogenase (short-subunit alcohol dehydrogenase family)
MNKPYPYIPDEFKDKRVLVTGGTKGAGEAIVRRFALAGASVATADRSPLPVGQNPRYSCRRILVASRVSRNLRSAS